jgi:hypothetical protein
VPIYPDDFDLLGFKLGPYFFIDKCLPMGYSASKLFIKFWQSSVLLSPANKKSSR